MKESCCSNRASFAILYKRYVTSHGRPPLIESFGFGSLVIKGKTYTSDLIVYPDGRITDSWRRKSGHCLSTEDICELIVSAPETIVVGTGINGLMKPDRYLNNLLHQKGIRLIAEKNERAVEHYNRLSPTQRVGACFHLTCQSVS